MPKIILRIAALLLICTFFLLTGCATLDSSNSGQIAGSIGQMMTLRDSYSTYWFLEYRSVDKKHRGSLAGGSHAWPISSLTTEIKEGDYRGKTFLKTLPPGEYAFVNPSDPSFIGILKGRTEVELARFTVRPGKVTYVGAWTATPVKGRTLIGIEKSIGFTVSVQNREARDMAIISRKKQDLLPSGNTSMTQSSATRPRSATPQTRGDGGTEYLDSSW